MRPIFLFLFLFAASSFACEQWLTPFSESDYSQAIGLDQFYQAIQSPVPYDFDPTNSDFALAALNTKILSELPPHTREQYQRIFYQGEMADHVLFFIHTHEDLKAEQNDLLTQQLNAKVFFKTVPRIQLVSTAFPLSSKLDWKRKAFIRYSEQGELHRYSPRAKVFYISGQFYERCVMRTMASVIKKFASDPDWPKLEFVLVTDWLAQAKTGEAYFRAESFQEAKKEEMHFAAIINAGDDINFEAFKSTDGSWLFRELRLGKELIFRYLTSSDII